MKLSRARQQIFYRTEDLTKLTWDPHAKVDEMYIITETFIRWRPVIVGKKQKFSKRIREIYTYIGFRNGID